MALDELAVVLPKGQCLLRNNFCLCRPNRTLIFNSLGTQEFPKRIFVSTGLVLVFFLRTTCHWSAWIGNDARSLYRLTLRVEHDVDVSASSVFTLLIETCGLTLCEGGCLLGALVVLRTWLCKLLAYFAFFLVTFFFWCQWWSRFGLLSVHLFRVGVCV